MAINRPSPLRCRHALSVGAIVGALIITSPATAESWPILTLPSITGKQLRVTAAAHKALIVLYVRADQARSKKAMRTAQKLFQLYRKKGLGVVAIATGRHQGYSNARRIAKMLKVTYPVLIDEDGKLRIKQKMVVYPSAKVVDKTGEVRYRYSGLRPGYAITIERQVKAVLGLGPPPEQIHDMDRRAVTSDKRKTDRRNLLKIMKRRRELITARRRFEATRGLLSKDTLPQVFKLYAKWWRRLPLPEAEALAPIADAIAEGGKASGAQLKALRSLLSSGKVKKEVVQLWLGRALAADKKKAGAKNAFEACQGKLRGQCDFELAAITGGDGAVALCKKGYKLAFP